MKIVNVGAADGSEAYLIITTDKCALIDSGFSFCAEQMIENIKRELGERPLDYVLLTHSHYDHASGCAYCYDYWADVKSVCGEYATKIFAKESALNIMRDMNRSVATERGVVDYEDKIANLRVDIAVKDGDVIDLGEVTLRVMNAAGHTKCSIAFYCPEEKMLFSSETMGVCAGGDIVAPAYLVGYQISIDFIDRVSKLEVEHILVPHYGVLSGEECRRFIANAKRCAVWIKDLIVDAHKQGKDYTEILQIYKDAIMTDELRRIQPMKAFELNAKYLIPMLIKECSE